MSFCRRRPQIQPCNQTQCATSSTQTVSRATEEGLHLLWQLRRRGGRVGASSTKQPANQRARGKEKKKKRLAKIHEVSVHPSSQQASRPAGQPGRTVPAEQHPGGAAVIWPDARMLIECIRLIDQIPAIGKSVWFGKGRLVFRCGKRDGRLEGRRDRWREGGDFCRTFKGD